MDDRWRVVEATPAGGGQVPGTVHARAVYVGEFRDVSAYVVALGIEAGRLPQRVQYLAGPGVVAGAGNPLPVTGVVGDVAVGQPFVEMAQPIEPVDAEVPGQERCGDPAGAVVHEPLAVKLPYPGVDDRDAGHAVAPGVEGVGVPIPPLPARAIVLCGQGREGGGDLVVEVAPRELA